MVTACFQVDIHGFDFRLSLEVFSIPVAQSQNIPLTVA